MRKRVLGAVLASFVIALLLVELSRICAPAVMETEVLAQQALFPGLPCVTNDYDVEGTTYTPTGEDPWLLFELEGMSANTVEIRFAQALAERMTIEAYYAEDNNELSEENKAFVEVPISGYSVMVDLPKGCYTRLRLDLNGRFDLAGIDLREQRAIECRSPFRIDGLLSLWLLGSLFLIPISILTYRSWEEGGATVS